MRQIVIDALLAAGLDTPNVETLVAAKLPETVRRAIVESFLARIARRLRRAARTVDSRQGWLSLPEFAHVPVACAEDNLEALRDRIARLKKRIHSYSQQASQKLIEYRQQLRELRNLEKAVTPYFAGNPGITVTRAYAMHQEHLKTPVAKRNQKGNLARWRATKNQ